METYKSGRETSIGLLEEIGATRGDTRGYEEALSLSTWLIRNEFFPSSFNMPDIYTTPAFEFGMIYMHEGELDVESAEVIIRPVDGVLDFFIVATRLSDAWEVRHSINVDSEKLPTEYQNEKMDRRYTLNPTVGPELLTSHELKVKLTDIFHL